MGLVLEKMFSARSMRSGYKKENWSNHFNWALQGNLRRDGVILTSVESQKSGYEGTTVYVVITVRLL
jgi:hypothetical protein